MFLFIFGPIKWRTPRINTLFFFLFFFYFFFILFYFLQIYWNCNLLEWLEQDIERGEEEGKTEKEKGKKELKMRTDWLFDHFFLSIKGLLKYNQSVINQLSIDYQSIIKQLSINESGSRTISNRTWCSTKPESLP